MPASPPICTWSRTSTTSFCRRRISWWSTWSAAGSTSISRRPDVLSRARRALQPRDGAAVQRAAVRALPVADLKILLCKGFFAGPVSGADEALVSYAIHLRRAGHLQGVVLFYPPAHSDPYHRRLRQAGVSIWCITSSPIAHIVFRLVRQLGFLARFFFLLPPRSRRHVRTWWRRLTEWTVTLYLRRCCAYFARRRPDLIHVVTPDPGAAMMIRAGHAVAIPVLYQELGTPYFMPELAIHYERFSEVIPLCSEVAALSPRLATDWTGKLPWSH